MRHLLLVGIVAFSGGGASWLGDTRTGDHASPADRSETASRTVPEHFPAGIYALTNDIAVVIEPGQNGAETGGTWTFRIGDGKAQPVVQTGENRWAVPTLDIEFYGVKKGDSLMLHLKRYEEIVSLRPAAPGPAYSYEGRSITEIIEELTPRLMIGLNVPGTSIAVIQDGEISWLGQYGVKIQGSDEKVDASTVFEAASMSKPAYAYPFLKLVENGIMDLDVPLVNYLGEDYIPGEELHRGITARMVLSHTTGFPNWRPQDGNLTVNFQPGSREGYSGEGFLFLQTAVEKVTGKSTEAFVQEALLRPLGMSSSSYEWQIAYEETYATGHTSEGLPRPRRPYTSANSAYTLYTTPADFARLLIEIMQEDRTAGHSLSRESVAALLTPNVYIEGRAPISRRGGVTDAEVHFALGWRVDKLPSGNRYYHSGSNSTGFQCFSEFDPATGNGIVIMTNSSSGSPLWRALMGAVGAP